MENIITQRITEENIQEIIDIWYETSIKAHSFIPKEYWKSNIHDMKTEYIPNSETYKAMQNEKILGFISLVDDYLAALFVKPEFQRNGIGRILMNIAKSERNYLKLKVYKKNENSINFYKSQDFKIISESIDYNTNENELLMQWSR